MTGFERTRPVQVCWLATGFRVFGKQNGRLVGSWEVDFSFSVAPINDPVDGWRNTCRSDVVCQLGQTQLSGREFALLQDG